MQPNLSAVAVHEYLNKAGFELSYDFVNDLVREIDVERLEKADKIMLNHFVVEFIERIKLTDKVLWGILTETAYDPKTGLGSTKREKLTAAKELRNNMNVLFQTMLDAGIFKRHLGELKIPDMGKILDMAKAIENGADTRQIIFDSSGDSDKKEL